MSAPPSPIRLPGRRPRLLVVGDAVASTGFARVMHSIFVELASSYEIHQIGINYHGDPHELPWKIYPAKSGGDLHGVGRLRPMIEQLQPDLVFILNDIWVLAEYMDALGELAEERSFALVMYCPIDAGPIEAEVIEKLEGVDRFVTYTKFGVGVIEAALTELRARRPDFEFPAVERVAHGVDVDRFAPHAADLAQLNSEGRRAARRRLFGDDPEMRDAFIVLNANRNQPRKRIDLTIEGFARFAAGKAADVKLHLHMGVEDAGWNVMTLCRRHGVAERLILSCQGDGLPSVPDAQLRDMFAAAAVGLNTSIAEGWGLVAFEHAATGAAQVVPRHSACAELWEGAAILVEPVAKVTTPQILTEGYLLDAEGVAAALEALYCDRQRLADMSRAAYARATQACYRWSTIAEQWRELFDEALARTPACAPERARAL